MTTNEELFKLLVQIERKLDLVQSTPIKTHLKTKEACNYLSVSPNTLTRICAEHGIDPKPIGGCNYYRVSDLEKLFN
jgi:hypothetical protein